MAFIARKGCAFEGGAWRIIGRLDLVILDDNATIYAILPSFRSCTGAHSAAPRWKHSADCALGGRRRFYAKAIAQSQARSRRLTDVVERCGEFCAGSSARNCASWLSIHGARRPRHDLGDA